MSPRRNRRTSPSADSSRDGDREDATFGARRESADDGDWLVRQVTGVGATKTYRCPGCDQRIGPGTPHLVAWSADQADAADRRHWHAACWRARLRRMPRIQRSRNAPRY